MNFQRYVIIFFVILLLIIMIFLGVTMSNNKATNIPWPPIISSCPDYWTDTPDEPPEEFVTECILDISNNKICTLIPNPANKNYQTYINVYDQSNMTYNAESTIGTYSGQSTTAYMCVDSSGNIASDCTTNKNYLNLTCIDTDKCGALIPNPNYTSTYTPQPHVSGSRCIGTIGQNSGNVNFSPENSNCSIDDINCSPKKTATMDFTIPDGDTNYIGANGNCNKQNWAKSHGYISWDGITYGYGEQNPCWTP